MTRATRKKEWIYSKDSYSAYMQSGFFGRIWSIRFRDSGIAAWSTSNNDEVSAPKFWVAVHSGIV